ncbi:hypothetical protein B0H10DRAFT_1941060 [Mycena sp. CBHHK59/15]|nr:hypothetical protein B0H10DRAFT_1941060 [Mycena sp. CBHHK59/15]
MGAAQMGYCGAWCGCSLQGIGARAGTGGIREQVRHCTDGGWSKGRMQDTGVICGHGCQGAGRVLQGIRVRADTSRVQASSAGHGHCIEGCGHQGKGRHKGARALWGVGFGWGMGAMDVKVWVQGTMCRVLEHGAGVVLHIQHGCGGTEAN